MTLERPTNLASRPATRSDSVVVAAFVAICAVVVSMTALAAQDLTGQLAVVYPPWTSGADSLSRAAASGASLVGLGRFPFIVIVAPGSAEQIRRIRADGAVATLNAAGLGGCLNAPSKAAS